MERFSNIATAEMGRQPEASSQIARTEVITDEQREAMGDVIDRWRLNKGWNPLDNESQEMAIQSWVNVANSENIPHTAYNELFVRALKMRASLFAAGKQPPEMGIELMLACWESLAKEIEERRISEKRFLPTNAASVCKHCFGSNFRIIKQGEYSGTIKCNHED